jgi:hypothetical protein
VPWCREMLSDTIQRVFDFPCHTDSIESRRPIFEPAFGEPGKSRKVGSIRAFRDDFCLALSYMEENQQHIDRISSFGTTFLLLEDSRLGRQDNRNVGRLTWLATFFIPLSFMASLFTLQADVSQLTKTYILYAKVALPFAVLFLVLTGLTLPFGQRIRLRIARILGISRDD